MEKICVIVMMKYPLIGTVKTRLAHVIGEKNAYRLYLKFLKDTLTNIISDDHDVILSILGQRVDISILDGLGNWDLIIEQFGEDLGQRQFHSLRKTFQMGYDISMVITGDCPEISRSNISDAVKALGYNDTVMGPCPDGGYYLFGTRKDKLTPEIFENIPWDSNTVSDDLRSNLEELGLSLATIGELNDIDDMDDLRSFYEMRSKDMTSSTMDLLKDLVDEGVLELDP